MKKDKILEYYEGNPDTIEEFDDENGEYITSYGYNNPNVISFAYFQTSLDGDKEFIYNKGLSHYAISGEIAKKIIGKAYASEDVDHDFVSTVTFAIYNNAAYKGRVFLNISVITTWTQVSSRKLAEIVDKMGGLEKFEDFIYVNPEGNGRDNMSVIDYINSNIEAKYEKHEEELMSHNIKDSSMIDPWMIDLIREYNTPNSKLADKTSKLGNMTIAQYNSLIRQEGKEGKETINEYYGGNPDTLARYDYTRNKSGLFGKLGGLYNKLRGNKIYNPWHLKQEFYWNEGNTITFGYFQDSIDGEKVFKKIENGNVRKIDSNGHQDIVRACTDSYIRKAKSRIGNGGYSDIFNAIMNTSACKGRLFLKQKVLTTWGVVSSARLKEIVNLLGIENPQEYYYVINRVEEYNLLEYINANNTNTHWDGDEERFRTKIEDLDDKDLQRAISIVREYNSPSSKLVDKSRKLGNMTIAQYNSLIHQEEKEPKKTIKENKDNMKNNKHQEEFSNYIKIMDEALQKNDYKAYEYVKEMLDEAVDESKHEKELMNELNTTNFGVLNHIFESELPTLIKTNKKAVRNVIKTIKEDKNLQSQFSFYNVIKEQYNSSHAEMITPEVALEKLVKIVCEEIDPKTIKKSNKKLRDVMIENNIIPSDFIDEESKKLYENGNVILTTKRTSNNMLPLAESYDAVCKWMTAHKDDKVKNTKDVDTLVREFEEKLKTNLNESEMSFVQEITDFRSPIAEKRKEKLFNKFKNECISKINDMLKEDAENAELKGLSEQINEMTFDKNNIVKDIAKLLEIRDILMDD